MTYFTLFCFILLGFVVLVQMIRIGVMEEHVGKMQHEVFQLTIQMDKKDRLRPTLWRNVVTGEEADYD